MLLSLAGFGEEGSIEEKREAVTNLAIFSTSLLYIIAPISLYFISSSNNLSCSFVNSFMPLSSIDFVSWKKSLCFYVLTKILIVAEDGKLFCDHRMQYYLSKIEMV